MHISQEVLTVEMGLKDYELSNHLGNVLAVVSDKKEQVNGVWQAIVLSAKDYYPFGMSMPGRGTEGGSYRYGFNGKETDPETDIQDYGMRWYLPNIARFPSADPLTKEYPWNSVYCFAENDVISCIDLDGLEKVAISGAVPPEEYYKIDNTGNRVAGTTHYSLINVYTFYNQADRLRQKGFSVLPAYSGKELTQRLKEETFNSSTGEIARLAIFAHGGPQGIFLRNNRGLYCDESERRRVGILEADDLDRIKKIIESGQIKFSKDAICFIDACSVGGTYSSTPDNSELGSNTNFAAEMAEKLGITVIAATGHMEMTDPKNANGQLKISDEDVKKGAAFYKVYKNSNGKVTSEKIGTTIKMDDYVD